MGKGRNINNPEAGRFNDFVPEQVGKIEVP